MTAAMAFFAVAVTLNLTGVHLTQMRASDLRPSSLKRSFYQANAHAVRYYDNLRVVYELESRVHDLQRSAEVDGPESPVAQPAEGPRDTQRRADPTAPAANPGTTPEKPVRQRPKPGTSLREPLLPDRRISAALERPGAGSSDRHLSGAGEISLQALATLPSEQVREFGPTRERDLA